MGFGKDGKGAIIRENTTISVGALAEHGAAIGSDLTITDDFRILKTVVSAHISGLTDPEGSGLIFGICNGELTAAEVAACLQLDGPTDRNDRVAQEYAERNCYMVGKSSQDLIDEGTAVLLRNFLGKQGEPLIEFSHRWTYANPEGWNWFVFNDLNVTLTTGATVFITATHYGVWVT